jgi:hypothetical protein
MGGSVSVGTPRVIPVNNFPMGGANTPQFQVTNFGSVNGELHVSGNTQMEGHLQVNGGLDVVGTKNFVQPNPLDPSKSIRFVSLEGNESGTYFRGSSTLKDGKVTIVVPEEFALVSDERALTVQLTARGRADLWVESVDLNQVVVRGDTDVAFDYLVNGVRRGFMDMQVIVENTQFRPQYRGVPAFPEMPLAWRMILVENGILNPDFTPNEATYAKHGWTLIDPATAQK